MQSFPRKSVNVWTERLAIFALTSLFHYFPVPTLAFVLLLGALRIGMMRGPVEFRDWR